MVMRLGSMAHWSYLLPDPAALGSIPSITPKKFSEEKIINISEVYQLCWLGESKQGLENADQTFLLLASGKLVHQKTRF